MRLPADIGTESIRLRQTDDSHLLTFITTQTRQLPSSMAALTCLTSLCMSDNLFTSVPPVVWELPLVELIMDSACGGRRDKTRSLALAEGVGKVTTLRRLNAAGNNIVDVPESLSGLGALSHLNLSRNQIAKVFVVHARCLRRVLKVGAPPHHR